MTDPLHTYLETTLTAGATAFQKGLADHLASGLPLASYEGTPTFADRAWLCHGLAVEERGAYRTEAVGALTRWLMAATRRSA